MVTLDRFLIVSKFSVISNNAYFCFDTLPNVSTKMVIAPLHLIVLE
jgi:hypothetical protein